MQSERFLVLGDIDGDSVTGMDGVTGRGVSGGIGCVSDVPGSGVVGDRESEERELLFKEE